jgi:hypothetical protein
MFPRFHATTRYELIEIPVLAGVAGALNNLTKFNVPDQPQLRTDQDADIIIQAIETFDILGISLSPNNNPVASTAVLLQTYLTLYIQGEESVYRVPLNQIKRINSEGAAVPYQRDLQAFKNIQVDWTKSYFSTPTPYTAGIFPAFSFLLGVHYMKLPPKTMEKIAQMEYNNFCNIGR